MRKFLFIQIVLVSILSFILVAVALAKPVQAKDVDITYNLDYYIESANKMRIVESHTIKNNSVNSVLKKENQDTFVINHIKGKAAQLRDSAATVSVTVDGKTSPFSVDYKDTSADIAVDYPRRIKPGDSITFVLQYENVGLIENTGALFDLYVPGLAKDALLETDTQSFSYNTNVYISNSVFPELNFVMPTPTTQEILANNITHYSYNRESIMGKTIWIQMGRKQFYHFSIKEQAHATMTNNLGLQNEYALVLPRDVADAEIYQQVYYDSIQPQPDYTEQDSDGNLIAHFRLPSTDNSVILVEGYAEVGVTGVKVDASNSGSLTDSSLQNLRDAIKPATYWEVGNSEIQQAAKSAQGTETNIYKILGATFSYVTGRINYSEVKRFGVNTRQGALATLHSGSGVCMEYSDLFLTIARAQGIPTRAVFGYGYDPQQSNSAQESHQWVVSYLPGLNKWYDEDVTWGDSGQIAEGGYLNHFYTHIVTAGPEALPEVAVKVYGGNNVLDLPQYQITAQASLPAGLKLSSQAEMLAKYPSTSHTVISDWVAEVPLKVSSYFTDISNRDILSTVVLSIGFILIISPLVYLVQRQRAIYINRQKKKLQEP